MYPISHLQCGGYKSDAFQFGHYPQVGQIDELLSSFT